MFTCAHTVEDIGHRRTLGGGECRSQAGCKRPLWGRTDQTLGVGPRAWSGTEIRQVNINNLDKRLAYRNPIETFKTKCIV